MRVSYGQACIYIYIYILKRQACVPPRHLSGIRIEGCVVVLVFFSNGLVEYLVLKKEVSGLSTKNLFVIEQGACSNASYKCLHAYGLECTVSFLMHVARWLRHGFTGWCRASKSFENCPQNGPNFLENRALEPSWRSFGALLAPRWPKRCTKSKKWWKMLNFGAARGVQNGAKINKKSD